jgi:cation diffusion facilitator family transporter
MTQKHSDGTFSIYASLGADVVVVGIKLGAWAFSGSSGILVEAIHSVIDSANEVLLLFGTHRAKRRPNKSHPFGYGLDSYFWTFIVVLLIFAGGGMAAINEGIWKLAHPTPVQHAPLVLTVIVLSIVIDIGSFWISLSDTQRRIKIPPEFGRLGGLLTYIHHSTDPGVYAILAEDLGSIVGLLIAGIGVVGSAWLGWPRADAISAIAIGALLICVACVLFYETHSLLTGESAPTSLVAKAEEIISESESIEELIKLRTMQLGPNQILVAATLRFRAGLSVEEASKAIRAIDEALKQRDARFTNTLIQPG